MPKLNGFPIERKQLKELTKAPWNPRKISDEQAKALAKSVETFGLVEPIIWNKRSQHVCGGHQRIDALHKQGIVETDVIVVDLDDEHEKALNLALNKISGEWEIPKLIDLFAELNGGDFDVTLSGFSMEEIESYLVPPNFSPVSEDGQPRLDEKKQVECPDCGCKFTP